MRYATGMSHLEQVLADPRKGAICWLSFFRIEVADLSFQLVDVIAEALREQF